MSQRGMHKECTSACICYHCANNYKLTSKGDCHPCMDCDQSLDNEGTMRTDPENGYRTVCSKFKRGWNLMYRTHEIELNGKKFELPIVNMSDEIAIAVFDMLVHPEYVLPAAMALQGLIQENKIKFDTIVAPECKVIPLAYELATDYDCDMVILRKSEKKYNEDALAYPVTSITTDGAQLLHLTKWDHEKICGKKVLILDDVVSTGGTLDSIKRMMQLAQASVVGVATPIAEGDAADKYPDLIYAARTPIYPAY